MPDRPTRCADPTTTTIITITTMSDIYCKKCGEPWDAYGVRNGDMEPLEARRFLRGEGCPACHFATQCVECDGTGAEPPLFHRNHSDCPECGDRHKILVRRFPLSSTSLDYGYQPNVKTFAPEIAAAAIRIGKEEIRQSRDGLFAEFFILCPACMDGVGIPKHPDQVPTCQCCHGDGKFHPPGDPEAIEARAVSALLDETDDEPLGVLATLLQG